MNKMVDNYRVYLWYLVPREMTRNLLFVHVEIPIQVWIEFLQNF